MRRASPNHPSCSSNPTSKKDFNLSEHFLATLKQYAPAKPRNSLLVAMPAGTGQSASCWLQKSKTKRWDGGLVVRRGSYLGKIEDGRHDDEARNGKGQFAIGDDSFRFGRRQAGRVQSLQRRSKFGTHEDDGPDASLLPGCERQNNGETSRALRNGAEARPQGHLSSRSRFLHERKMR